MKPINSLAPVKFSTTITIQASPEKVWNILTTIAQWPEWHPHIASSSLNGPLQAGSSFDWKSSGAKIHSTLHTVEPCRYFGWTGKSYGVSAIHNWTIKEINGTTQLFVEESMEGLLASILKGWFNKMLEKELVCWLDLMKVTCESQAVSPKDNTMIPNKFVL